MRNQTLPITGLQLDAIEGDVLVCGDPARARQIAGQLSDVQQLSEAREYHIYQGRYGAKQITVCSHGIGAPGAAICFEELIAAGGRRIIRVGTCGGLQAGVKRGALVVATAAVQHTGYGREVAPPGYPAIADLDLTLALRAAAFTAHPEVHCGIVLTRDAFYAGIDTLATHLYAQMEAANIVAVEMECAALFLLGNLRCVQTAAILAVDGNVGQGAAESMETYRPHRPAVKEAVTRAIEIALKTLAGQPRA